MADKFMGLPVVDGEGEITAKLVKGRKGKPDRLFLCLPDGTRIAERKGGKWVSIPGGPVVADWSDYDIYE